MSSYGAKAKRRCVASDSAGRCSAAFRGKHDDHRNPDGSARSSTKRKRCAGTSNACRTTGSIGVRTKSRSPPAGSARTSSSAWLGRIDLFSQDAFDFDPATFKPYHASSVADLLDTFDARVADGRRAIAALADEDLRRLWQLKVMGRVRVEKPKAAAYRDFTLHHLIHHRGQLSVYLRLLDVAVPGLYGPTADDR